MRRTLRQVATATAALVLLAVSSSAPAQAFTCSSTFSRVKSPNPGKAYNYLASVDAISEQQAWAAGQSREKGNGNPSTVLEHFSNGSWKVVPSPNGAHGSTQLFGVTVVSNKLVFADGINVKGSNAKPIIVRWTPSKGAKMMSIPTPGAYTSLDDIDAVSPTDIWAVGSTGPTFNSNAPFILHWNGTAWSQASVPAPSATKNELHGVTVISATDVWAVGFQEQAGVLESLTLHYNGASWSVIPNPAGGGSDNILESVSGTSSSDVMAVGFSDPGDFQSLAMRWNGATWSIVPTTNPGTDNFLFDVSMASPTDAYAVGNKDSQSTVVEHWNGASWSDVTTPNPGPDYNVLASTVALSSGFYWAVGDEGAPFHSLTVVACV